MVSDRLAIGEPHWRQNWRETVRFVSALIVVTDASVSPST